jgi:hypothetical protein
MRTTDRVKDGVHALAGEAVDFLHKVLMLVINGDISGRSGGAPDAASSPKRFV